MKRNSTTETLPGETPHPQWPRILTVEMVAAYLGLSPKTIRNHGNQLPGERRWGGKVVFDRYEIDKMLDKARGLRSLWVDAEKARR